MAVDYSPALTATLTKLEALAPEAEPKDAVYIAKAIEALRGSVTVERIVDEGDTQKIRVGDEGDTQVDRVIAAGDAESANIQSLDLALYGVAGENASYTYDSNDRISSIEDSFDGIARSTSITYTTTTSDDVDTVVIEAGTTRATHSFTYNTSGLLSGSTVTYTAI